MSEKFTLMHAEKATFTIELMARLLGVSRAGYYAWAGRRDTLSSATARRLWLSGVIKQIHADSHGVNGFRRVLAELGRRGIAASEGLVRKIMRELGIFGIQPRSKKRTTIPAEDVVTRPDLLRRDFTADRPGVRFVGDITYLRTGEGWLYLATVIDLFNREVVGWSMADHMRTELISDALTMAHTHGRIEPGALFHSDRGSQTGLNQWKQHLIGGCCGTTIGLDERSDGAGADAVSWAPGASACAGARVLGEDQHRVTPDRGRRGDRRGSRSRVRRDSLSAAGCRRWRERRRR